MPATALFTDADPSPPRAARATWPFDSGGSGGGSGGLFRSSAGDVNGGGTVTSRRGRGDDLGEEENNSVARSMIARLEPFLSSLAAGDRGKGDDNTDDANRDGGDAYASFVDTPTRRRRQYASRLRRLIEEFDRMVDDAATESARHRSLGWTDRTHTRNGGGRGKKAARAAERAEADVMDALFVRFLASLIPGDDPEDAAEFDLGGRLGEGATSLAGRIGAFVRASSNALSAADNPAEANNDEGDEAIQQLPGLKLVAPFLKAEDAEGVMSFFRLPSALMKAYSAEYSVDARPKSAGGANAAGSRKRRRVAGDSQTALARDPDAWQVLLGYALCHLASACLIEAPNAEMGDFEPSNNAAVVPWTSLTSFVLGAARSMGLTSELRRIRAGVAAYALDGMSKSVGRKLEEERAEDDWGEEGIMLDGSPVGNEGALEERKEGNASNNRQWLCAWEDVDATVAIEGLSPRALVDFALGDKGAISTLVATSGLPHRRELLASISDVLLDYDFHHNPWYKKDSPESFVSGGGVVAAIQNGGQEDDLGGVGANGTSEALRRSYEGAAAALDLLLKGDDKLSSREYLAELGNADHGGNNNAGVISFADSASRGTSSGQKRKRGDSNLETAAASTGDDNNTDVPSWPTAYPILVELKARLCLFQPDVGTAARLCLDLDASPGVTEDEKREGWWTLLDYLHQRGVLLDGDSGRFDAEWCARGGENGWENGQGRHFDLLSLGSDPSSPGPAALSDFLRDLVVDAMERAEGEAANGTNETSAHAREYFQYIQCSVRRTVLKFWLRRSAMPLEALRRANAVSLWSGDEDVLLAPPPTRAQIGGNRGAAANVLDRIRHILRAPAPRAPPPLALPAPRVQQHQQLLESTVTVPALPPSLPPPSADQQQQLTRSAAEDDIVEVEVEDDESDDEGAVLRQSPPPPPVKVDQAVEILDDSDEDNEIYPEEDNIAEDEAEEEDEVGEEDEEEEEAREEDEEEKVDDSSEGEVDGSVEGVPVKADQAVEFDDNEEEEEEVAGSVEGEVVGSISAEEDYEEEGHEEEGLDEGYEEEGDGEEVVVGSVEGEDEEGEGEGEEEGYDSGGGEYYGSGGEEEDEEREPHGEADEGEEDYYDDEEDVEKMAEDARPSAAGAAKVVDEPIVLLDSDDEDEEEQQQEQVEKKEEDVVEEAAETMEAEAVEEDKEQFEEDEGEDQRPEDFREDEQGLVDDRDAEGWDQGEEDEEEKGGVDEFIQEVEDEGQDKDSTRDEAEGEGAREEEARAEEVGRDEAERIASEGDEEAATAAAAEEKGDQGKGAGADEEGTDASSVEQAEAKASGGDETASEGDLVEILGDDDDDKKAAAAAAEDRAEDVREEEVRVADARGEENPSSDDGSAGGLERKAEEEDETKDAEEMETADAADADDDIKEKAEKVVEVEAPRDDEDDRAKKATEEEEATEEAPSVPAPRERSDSKTESKTSDRGSAAHTDEEAEAIMAEEAANETFSDDMDEADERSAVYDDEELDEERSVGVIASGDVMDSKGQAAAGGEASDEELKHAPTEEMDNTQNEAKATEDVKDGKFSPTEQPDEGKDSPMKAQENVLVAFAAKSSQQPRRRSLQSDEYDDTTAAVAPTDAASLSEYFTETGSQATYDSDSQQKRKGGAVEFQMEDKEEDKATKKKGTDEAAPPVADISHARRESQTSQITATEATGGSVLVQAAAAAASRRPRSESDYDDTTAAVAATDASISEYFTETGSQAETVDSDGKERVEIETKDMEDKDVVEHQKRPRPPLEEEEMSSERKTETAGSVLVAAATAAAAPKSPKGDDDDDDDASSTSSERPHDDTTAAVAGTDAGEYLDECYTEATESQASKEDVAEEAAEIAHPNGGATEGTTSAEVSLVDNGEAASAPAPSPVEPAQLPQPMEVDEPPAEEQRLADAAPKADEEETAVAEPSEAPRPAEGATEAQERPTDGVAEGGETKRAEDDLDDGGDEDGKDEAEAAAVQPAPTTVAKIAARSASMVVHVPDSPKGSALEDIGDMRSDADDNRKEVRPVKTPVEGKKAEEEEEEVAENTEAASADAMAVANKQEGADGENSGNDEQLASSGVTPVEGESMLIGDARPTEDKTAEDSSEAAKDGAEASHPESAEAKQNAGEEGREAEPLAASDASKEQKEKAVDEPIREKDEEGKGPEAIGEGAAAAAADNDDAGSIRSAVSDMSYNELRRKCLERGLRAGGTKEELRARLGAILEEEEKEGRVDEGGKEEEEDNEEVSEVQGKPEVEKGSEVKDAKLEQQAEDEKEAAITMSDENKTAMAEEQESAVEPQGEGEAQEGTAREEKDSRQVAAKDIRTAAPISGSKDADEDDDSHSVDSVVSTMSYRELRAECKKKGLSTKGKTDVLRNRLMEAIEEHPEEEEEAKIPPAKVEVAAAESKPGSKGADEEDAESVGSHVSTMSYNELKNECKKKGLKATGKKEVLQKRLLEAIKEEPEDDEGPPLVVTTTNAPPAAILAAIGDDASVVSGMSYHELRKKCKEMEISAMGKTDELKKRILEKLAEERNKEIGSVSDKKPPAAAAVAAGISTPVRTSRSHMPSEGTSAYTPSRDAQVQTQHDSQEGTAAAFTSESPSRDVPKSVKGAPSSPAVSSIASSPDALVKKSRKGKGRPRLVAVPEQPESKKQKVGDGGEGFPSPMRKSTRRTRGKHSKRLDEEDEA